MIPEHLAQALTGQFSSDPKRRALEIVERVQEWTGQSAEVETIDYGLQLVSVAGITVAHSPVDTPAVLKANIEQAIAARAPKSSEEKTYDEWRVHCGQLAAPILGELFGLFTKIWDDPGPNEQRQPDVLTPSMVTNALRVGTRIPGWRCAREGSRLVVSEPLEQPKPPVPVTDPCGIRVECGGSCVLQKNHEPPCLCAGDTDGPGSCEA